MQVQVYTKRTKTYKAHTHILRSSSQLPVDYRIKRITKQRDITRHIDYSQTLYNNLELDGTV